MSALGKMHALRLGSGSCTVRPTAMLLDDCSWRSILAMVGWLPRAIIII